MGKWYVTRVTFGYGERQADNFGAHVVEARCLGVEGDEFGLSDFPAPGFEGPFIEHGLVIGLYRFLDGLGRRAI